MSGVVEAQAQSRGGFYVSGAAGLDRRQNFKITGAEYMSYLMGSPTLSSGRADLTSSLGFVGVAAVGYDFGGPRVELEGNFRTLGVSKMREFGRSLTGVSGSTRSMGMIGNAYYDIDLGRYGQIGGTRLTPYLGAGFGFGVTAFDKVHGTLAANSTNTTINGTGSLAPAYNLIAGTSIGLDSLAPGLSATVEWRYYTVFNRTVSTTVNNPGTSPIGVNANLNRVTQPNCCHDNSVLVGLRYAFGTTASMLADPNVPMTSQSGTATTTTPPAAIPAPVRTYLVMFALNKSTLDGAANDVVRAAATAARGGQAVRLALTGRADNTGPADLNSRLSRARAETVATALARDGVPRGRMTVRSVGDTDPLVPTPAGTPEPRNRSVEIVVR